MTNPVHLLLAVGADGDAPALVDQCWRLSAGLGGSWSVVGIDTPATEHRGPDWRASLLEALDRAESLGATISRISTGTHTPTGLVSALVHRAVREQATVLVIGRPRNGGAAWGPPGQGLSEFAAVLSQLLPGVTVHIVALPDERGAKAAAAPAPGSGGGRRRLRAGWPGRAREGGRQLLPLLAMLALCTAIGAALEPFVPPAHLVMVYLAGVVWLASRATRAVALAAVAGSVLLYNLLFVAPRWSLEPTDPQHGVAFVVMLIAGLVVSGLAARSREQALVAEARAQRTEALNRLAVALGRARDADAVARALEAAVHAATGARSRLLPLAGEGAAPSWRDPGLGPGFVPERAAQALALGAETGAGTPRGGDEPMRCVPLLVGDQGRGVLVVNGIDPARDLLEDRHLVRALANQAAVALERADFERRSASAAVEAERERTRNTLLAGISHDFRTPLTTIVGSATTLIEQGHALDETQRLALLRGLLAEARRLHLLGSNLLDLTRLDEGAMALRPEWCPADELVHEAKQQLGALLDEAALDLQVAPEALVWCDPRLVVQVLVNLLHNALRHGPPGAPVTVAVGAGARDWTLRVHDRGPGVPAGQEQAVFRRFHRAGAGGAGSENGSEGGSEDGGKGLGLAICAAVARLHGGTIAVHNDGGACFVMTLPQAPAPRLADAEAA